MSRIVCGRSVGNGRICTLHPTHQIPCSGNTPEFVAEVATAENEMMTLTFQLGISLASYDPRHFRSQTHCDEAIDFHIARLGMTLNEKQLQLLRATVFRYFNC